MAYKNIPIRLPRKHGFSALCLLRSFEVSNRGDGCCWTGLSRPSKAPLVVLFSGGKLHPGSDSADLTAVYLRSFPFENSTPKAQGDLLNYTRPFPSYEIKFNTARCVFCLESNEQSIWSNRKKLWMRSTEGQRALAVTSKFEFSPSIFSPVASFNSVFASSQLSLLLKFLQ
jgi:hypothetical protein